MESKQILNIRSHHEAVVYLGALLENGLIKPQKRSTVEWLIAVFGYWNARTNRAMASHLSYGYSVRPDLTATDSNDETVRRFSRRMMQRLAKDKVLWVEDKPNRYGTNTIKFSLRHLGYWLEKVSVQKCPPKEVINNDRQASRNIVPVRELLSRSRQAMDSFVQHRIAKGVRAACDKIFRGHQHNKRQQFAGQGARARQSLAKLQQRAAEQAQQQTRQRHVQIKGKFYLESEAIELGLLSPQPLHV